MHSSHFFPKFGNKICHGVFDLREKLSSTWWTQTTSDHYFSKQFQKHRALAEGYIDLCIELCMNRIIQLFPICFILLASSTQWTWIWANSRRYWEAWHAAVHGVSKSWTWLSNWTTTTVIKKHLLFTESPEWPHPIKGGLYISNHILKILYLRNF